MKTSFSKNQSTSSQKAVSGTANTQIQGLYPFIGTVKVFSIKQNVVHVQAEEVISPTASRTLELEFESDIGNGEHDFVEGGKVKNVSFIETYDGTSTRYSAVSGTGYVEFEFSLSDGTLEAKFVLAVQESPTEPQREATGAFEEVSGLEHVK